MTARGFYAALGVELPAGTGPEIPARCFANPSAHRHDDRTPSASVNTDTGVFYCHGCGVGGGPYAAALALGRRPADAMALLEAHGLTAGDEGRAPVPARAARKAFSVTEADVERYATALRADPAAVARLARLRGWSASAVERLGLGLDGDRVVFPVRDADGALVGLLRYAPDAARRDGGPKMLAAPGSARDLFPAPEALPAGERVWLVEGEPDAVAAHTLDLAAVAMPGAGKWSAGWGRRFAARDVVVCCDCDPAGRRAARRAAEAILPHAASVRVIDIEPDRDDGADIGDWTLDASRNGGTRHARALLDGTVERTPPLVAERAAQPEAIGELLDEVESCVARYVVLPGDAEAVTVALFVAHTHAVEAAHATPYLIVLSPERRTGKTLMLEVLELLCARPWRVVAASEAAMFRKLARDRPTLLLDEIDAIFGAPNERTEPLRALLNAGNRPGSCVARCVGKGSDQTVVDFDVFGPKVLAGIDTGRLPDTIRDRGLELRMKRKTAAERVERFRHRHAAPAAKAISDRLAAWGAREASGLRDAEPDLPPALHDRAAEAWEPLLAIADDAAGEWPRRARAAAVAIAAGADSDEASHGTRVLAALAGLLSDRSGVSTDRALGAINGDDELPYGGWRDGRGLDARGLARLLKPYGVRPRTVRLPEGETAKGYRRDDTAEEAFARYLPTSASQGSRPSQGAQPPPGNPRCERVVTVVTDVTATAGKPARDGSPGWDPTAADAFVKAALEAFPGAREMPA